MRLDGAARLSEAGSMCNLYSVTKGQQAILEFARAMRDAAGNLPSMPNIYPDYEAPIVRTGEDGVRELVRARWRCPAAFLP